MGAMNKGYLIVTTQPQPTALRDLVGLRAAQLSENTALIYSNMDLDAVVTSLKNNNITGHVFELGQAQQVA